MYPRNACVHQHLLLALDSGGYFHSCYVFVSCLDVQLFDIEKLIKQLYSMPTDSTDGNVFMKNELIKFTRKYDPDK